MSTTVTLTPQQVARRRRYTRIWVASTIAWSLTRTIVVWATLSRYGLDPWTYAAIDLGSAAILAVTTPRLVTSLVDRRRRRGAAWGAVTLLGYSIPDVYIFLSTDRLPIVVLVVLIAVIYVSIAIGGLALRRKVVAARALRAKVDLPVAA